MTSLLALLNKVALWLSGLAILAMTIIGGLDVIGYAVFGHPIPGAYESTETLMVVVVFLAFGLLHQNRAYISVDLLYRRVGARGQRALDIFTLLLITLFFVVVAWQGWLLAWRSWEIGEYSVGLVGFPIYPSKFALAIGASLAVLACLVDLARGGAFKKPADAAPTAVE